MKIVKIVFLLVAVTAFGQSKVGTVDIDFILSKMPELIRVQQQVDDYGKTLEKDYSEKLKTYDATIKNYQVEENVLTLAQSKTMQDSIVAMKENIDRYRNNANQLLAIKRDEFLQPLYSKIGGELEKIAAAQGYTQIFQRTNDLIYIDNRFDVTLAVLKALGIEVEEN